MDDAESNNNMGRRRRRQSNFPRESKRRRQDRRNLSYWIEEFPEIWSDKEEHDFLVWITMVELFDCGASSYSHSLCSSAESSVTFQLTSGATRQLEISKVNKKSSIISNFTNNACGTETINTKTLASFPAPLRAQSASPLDPLATEPGILGISNANDPAPWVASGLGDKDSGRSATLLDEAKKSGNHFKEKKNPVIFFKRSMSAMRALNRNKSFDSCHVKFPSVFCSVGTDLAPPNRVLEKYWAQRTRLFSMFDHGIQIDDEGWFSVTPEVIAHHITRRMIGISPSEITAETDSTTEDHIEYVDNVHRAARRAAKKMPLICRSRVVLDAFCGVGGNAIAFAQNDQVSQVICVDHDMGKLRMAANNCRVYGIPPDRVLFVHADAMDVISRYRNGNLQKPKILLTEQPKTRFGESCKFEFGCVDALPPKVDYLFLSPPWGGIHYKDVGRKHFDFSCIRLEHRMKRMATGNEQGNFTSNECKSDGEDLLRSALVAVPEGCNRVGYFLPRNTNGMSVAHSSYQCGCRIAMEFEQNIVNNKLKTITAYISKTVATNRC